MKTKNLIILFLSIILIVLVVVFIFFIPHESPKQKEARELSEKASRDLEELEKFNNEVDRKLEKRLEEIDEEAIILQNIDKLEKLGYTLDVNYENEKFITARITNGEIFLSSTYTLNEDESSFNLLYIDKDESVLVDGSGIVSEKTKNSYSSLIKWLDSVNLTEKEIMQMMTYSIAEKMKEIYNY